MNKEKKSINVVIFSSSCIEFASFAKLWAFFFLFQGVNNEKYSLPPYPPYIDPFSMDQEMQDNSNENENVYDTCYHLLKLYCDRSYRLDKLLMPETYTTDHLDYRLR